MVIKVLLQPLIGPLNPLNPGDLLMCPLHQTFKLVYCTLHSGTFKHWSHSATHGRTRRGRSFTLTYDNREVIFSQVKLRPCSSKHPKHILKVVFHVFLVQIHYKVFQLLP